MYVILTPVLRLQDFELITKSAQLNTSTLTSWGIASLTSTPGSPNGYIPRLIFEGLPDQYKFNSSYALLPFCELSLGASASE